MAAEPGAVTGDRPPFRGAFQGELPFRTSRVGRLDSWFTRPGGVTEEIVYPIILNTAFGVGNPHHSLAIEVLHPISAFKEAIDMLSLRGPQAELVELVVSANDDPVIEILDPAVPVLDLNPDRGCTRGDTLCMM